MMSSNNVPTVRHSWQRLEDWCRLYQPEILDSLNPGATITEIRAFEETVGQTLPDDVRESYLIHNGQQLRDETPGIIMEYKLEPLLEVLSAWRHWQTIAVCNEEFRKFMASNPPDVIRSDYTNSGWIPLSNDHGGNHMGIDMTPGPRGIRGQVISFGRDEDTKSLLALVGELS